MATGELLDPFGWVGSAVAGKYRIDGVVAEGGFGVVYRAQHLGFDSRIAVKCLKLPAQLKGDDRAKFLEAFVAEGKLLHQLSRQTIGIVQALDVGADTSPNGTWTPYLALEWLDGASLEDDLLGRAQARMPARSLTEAIALLEPAARALGVAHERGIAHRDIKPANLLIAEIGGRRTLKVVDFGIAKVMTEATSLTRALQATGASLQAFTPQYGAPEQFDRTRYGATGPWTDVFALALVLVEVLGDRPALDGGDTTQFFISSIHPERRPTPRQCGIGVPDAVEAVMVRAVTVDPKNRFHSAGAFWDALVAAAAPRSSAEATIPTSYVPQSAPTRPDFGAPALAPRPSSSTTSPHLAPLPAPHDARLSTGTLLADAPNAQLRPNRSVPRDAGGRTILSVLGIGGTLLVAAALAALGYSRYGVTHTDGAMTSSSTSNTVPLAPTVPTSPSGRYTPQPCGSILDGTTNLEWFVGSDHDTTWSAARSWTFALNTCGAHWRMPTAKELRGLYDANHNAGIGYLDHGKRFPAKIDPAFAAIGGGSWVWTDQAIDDENASAYNFFINGPVPMRKDLTGPGTTRFATRAFAVRGAHPGPAPSVTHSPLAHEDEGFVDTRGGWDWGDRCWTHLRAGNFTWAKAACDKGMAMNPASPQPRASLLYNEGLIAKATGDTETARNDFAESLALREHPEVRAALESLAAGTGW